jgi:hypothetical protein
LKVNFDIEDVNIVYTFDIDVFQLRYRRRRGPDVPAATAGRPCRQPPGAGPATVGRRARGLVLRLLVLMLRVLVLRLRVLA